MPADDSHIFTTNGGGTPTITRTVTKQVVPFTSNELVDPDVVVTKKHEEWTTSKRVVNHKTKQVETRVQRQLIMEDGRVVADTGPQVTTKTKEDVRVEESENSEHKTSGDDAPGAGYSVVPGSAQVVSEKTESTQTMTETKEENRQMHDEHVRDLSGEELHQRIIVAPDETDFGEGFCNFPGRLTHYSSRSQKVVDKEEVKEVSQLKDGELSTETTRTHHHEEAFDDEVPEDEAEDGMVPERSAETSRKIEYYTDPKEFEHVSNQLRQESRQAHSKIRQRVPPNDAVPAVTHKWLDDHFGSDNGSETARTRSGGNRITIEMLGHRSSPSDLSPRESSRKHDISRESTLRHHTSFDRSNYVKSPIIRSPSPPYPSSTLTRSNAGRNTTSPIEILSSSGSSRSKTPVKTFYLGEDNTYTNGTKNGWKNASRSSNKPLADVLKSSLSFGETKSDFSSNYDVHRNNSFYKTSTPRNRTPDSSFPSSRVFSPGPVYSNIRRTKSNKNIQVSMSDEEDNTNLLKINRKFRERSLSPHRLENRTATTLPRNIKHKEQPKTLLSPIYTKANKHYKSSESILSPNHSNYSSVMDYGSTNSFKYSDHRSKYSDHRSTPLYIHTSSTNNTLKGSKYNDNYHKNDWNSTSYTDTFSTSKSNRNKEYKSDKSSSYRYEDVRNDYETLNGKRNGSSKYIYNGSGISPRYIKSKHLISPPESGYQSPLPPTPPSSPPPRLIKVLNSDHYGSSSSMSPPDSPLHNISSSSIKRSSAYPSGSTSRSKSSGDLRPSRLLHSLPSPTSFSPLSSPTELKSMSQKSDRQKYYRVKPGQDGQSVVVQVRDWNAR